MAPVKKEHHDLQPTFLRAWRKKAGLDQEAAAEKLEVSRTLLSKIENAKSPYTQRLLEKAGAIYDATPAELIACDPSGEDDAWATWLKVAKTSVGIKSQIISYAKLRLKTP